MWDSVTLECLRTLEGHEDNVRVLAVGDKYVFSGSWDKSIRCGASPPHSLQHGLPLASLGSTHLLLWGHTAAPGVTW